MAKNKEKEIKPQSIYDEMKFPAEEVAKTLPLEEPSYEGAIPDQPPLKPEKDYLDDFPSQQQQPKKEYSQPLMFGDEAKENLIADLLKVDWERVEHIIRGHKPKVGDDGSEYFVKIENHYLNDYGVNSILHFLSFYLSKDIKLGRYSAEQVQMIMKQFAKQFTDWFYDNIVEFGLDTPQKKKMSKMFVQSVIDLVDASYSCAIEGKTIELMLKQFTVMQQQPLFDGGYNPAQISQKPKVPMMQRIFG
ncbi:hypothetical protein LCGC14_0461870 [marine sediment metagenome]|uniref:Uncharacterized protein n=1 Tax=marine sediment metagenome TaxID=412755 RepID=A0A0F9VNI6_9ZZZZ